MIREKGDKNNYYYKVSDHDDLKPLCVLVHILEIKMKTFTDDT